MVRLQLLVVDHPPAPTRLAHESGTGIAGLGHGAHSGDGRRALLHNQNGTGGSHPGDAGGAPPANHFANCCIACSANRTPVLSSSNSRPELMLTAMCRAVGRSI